MLESIRLFLQSEITGPLSVYLIPLIILLGTALCAVVGYYITEGVLYVAEIGIRRTTTTWDDDLLNDGFNRAIGQLSPALIVHWLLPRLFGITPDSLHWIETLTSLYIVVTVVYIVCIFISNLYEAFLLRDHLAPYAVKGIFQMAKLIFICIGFIVGLSIVIGKSPLVIFTAMGASAAVLMLVFQDTILGLVASIQLTAQKMLKPGDWIQVSNSDINGEVLEVTLNAVKVRNWDNTVSTVPPSALIKGSFKNYQPMRESGGRRVDRSVYIDANTVRFCTPEQLEELRSLGWLDGIDIEDASRTINLGLFRNYMEHYLKEHPEVNHHMLCMVRQMPPTPSGLPLQLYFFTDTVAWTEYERIQADVFDHVYAAVQLFGLAIFQSPAGLDFLPTKQA